MTDSAEIRNMRTMVAPVAAGIVSGILYLSLALAPVFLIPLQLMFGRSGRKAGMVSAGAAACVIGAGQVWRMAGIGMMDAASLAFALAPPVAFAAALAALNAAFWSGVNPVYRGLAVTLALALAALPLVFDVSRDGNFTTLLEDSINAVIAPISRSAGEGYESSALAAALDVKTLVSAAKQILASSYAVFIFLLEVGSWWLGSRISGRDSIGRATAPALYDFRMPYALVWPFLAAWAAVLASLAFPLGTWFPAAAWNSALVLSLCYAAQGVGIATHFVRRRSLPGTVRLAIAVSVFAVLMSPVAGSIIAGAFTVLGITEVWIPYRNLKGVGA